MRINAHVHVQLDVYTLHENNGPRLQKAICPTFSPQVVRLGVDRQRCSAMVQFDSMEAAKDALNGIKGTFIGNSRRIMVRNVVCAVVSSHLYMQYELGCL